MSRLNSPLSFRVTNTGKCKISRLIQQWFRTDVFSDCNTNSILQRIPQYLATLLTEALMWHPQWKLYIHYTGNKGEAGTERKWKWNLRSSCRRCSSTESSVTVEVGRCQVVVRVLWSIKNTRPWLSIRASQPTHSSTAPTMFAHRHSPTFQTCCCLFPLKVTVFI